MLTGQAVGTLAALAVAEHIQPRDVSSDKVQISLLQSGAILAREKTPDFAAPSKEWQAAQFAIVHQWITVAGEDSFQPFKQLTRAESARILVNVFLGKRSGNMSVVNTGGFDPAPQILDQAYADVPLYDPIFNSVSALHAAGAAPVCSSSPKDFCPTYSITIGEFAQATAILSAAVDKAHAPDESALRAGITKNDGEPATVEDAAMILYNSVLLRKGQIKPAQ